MIAHDVRLTILIGAPSLDFGTNGADLVIEWSDCPTPGLLMQPLTASAQYPVLSPKMTEHEYIDHPEDLPRRTHVYDETHGAWREWFTGCGLAGTELPRGSNHPNCEL